MAYVLKAFLLAWLALPLAAHDLEGIVYAPDGTPVAGARVVAGTLATTTSGDGAFTLKNVPDGVVILRVTADGFAYPRRVVALAGDPPLAIIFALFATDEPKDDEQLVTGTGTIRGVVRLDGRPIAGVPVVVISRYPSSMRVSTISDVKGNFAVSRLPQGSYRVYAGDGLAPRIREVERLDVKLVGPLATVDLGVRAAPIVTGRVLDFESKPVARALVEPDRADGSSVCCSAFAARTRSDGTFAVVVPAEAHEKPTVLMVGARSSSVIRSEAFSPTARRHVEVKLPRFHVVTVRLTTHSGKPLAGARLTYTSRSETAERSVSSLLAGDFPDRILVAEEGGEIELRLTSDDYDLFVSAKGHQPRHVPQRIKRSASVDVALETAVAIYGRVLRNDRGVPGIHALMETGTERGTLEVMTDEAGRFAFEGLAPGPYSMVLSSDDKTVERTLEVKAPASLEIAVPATGRVRGRVADAVTGAAVESFIFSVVPVSPDETQPSEGISTTETSPLGIFEMIVPIGTYSVRARSQGFTVSRSVEVEVAEDATAGVQIELDRGSLVEGRVLDEDGAPVAGASVSGREEDDDLSVGPAESTSDASGAYVLTGLDTGMVDISVTHAETLDHQIRIELAGNQQLDLHVSRGLTIHGLVTLAGKPVPEAGISVSTAASHGQKTSPDSTGDDGRFILRGLAPARYVLTAEKGDNLGVVTIDPTRQGEVTIAIDPKDTSTIHGIVTGTGGVDGGILLVPEHGELRIADIKNGAYRIDDVPSGRAIVWVSLHSSDGELNSAPKVIEVTAGRATVLDFDLTPAARIGGRITLQGTPVVGEIVAFESIDRGSSTTTTQADGRYELSLPGLGHFSVEVGGSAGIRTAREFRGSETFDIEMAWRVVEGVVFDAETGKPAPRAEVKLVGDPGVMAEASTDASGRFRLEATMVPGGATSVVASADERVQQEKRVDLRSSSPKEISLTLTRGVELGIRAVDAQGGAPLKAVISLDDRWISCNTNESVSTCVFRVDPGTYKLTISAEGYKLQHTEVTAPGTIDIKLDWDDGRPHS